MNKTAVKNYAVEARKKWIQAIAQQAAFYGCTESGCLSDADITKQLVDKGVFLTANEKSARGALVNDINEKGYQNAIEEIAYTWFNRLIAIRFMEVNGYLPSGIRVLSSIDADRIEPDCVREYARLDFLNQDTAARLAAESDEKLYRYILVEQCNALGKIMPKMFTHIGGIAALLLPERLYIKDGLVHDLTHIKDVEESDFGEQIETIGWLYQYYISEKKDEVFAALKKNVKITRENIPAATQLFTPDWIVKYMVENSLGRLWLESHPDSKLHEGWKYYIDEAEQEPTVAEQLRVLRAQNPVNKPEDIKLIDPCMGSGHILVYAFDVLYQIYLSQGYSERDIPDLILDNNIYGLDIDERACQLAYFALMMKARSYNRRFFRRDDVPQPQVYSPQGYEDGMEYGSLVKVDVLEDKPLEKEVTTLFDTPYETELNTWNFRRLLYQKYDVVVTNPPYMGNGGFSAHLNDYIKEHYSLEKNDLYSVMMGVAFRICTENGYVAMITMQSWLNAPTFLKFRKALFEKYRLVSLNNLGSRAFDEIQGEKVKNTAFIFSKRHIRNWKPLFIDLTSISGEDAKRLLYLSHQYEYYFAKQDDFSNHPLCLVVYKTEQVKEIYNPSKLMREVCDIKRCIATGNDDMFIRMWHEVNVQKISKMEIREEKKWFYIANGGLFRRWYGNFNDIINWEDDGVKIKEYNKRTGKSTLRNIEFMFREGLTYTYTSMGSGIFNSRYIPSALVSIGVGPVIVNCVDTNYLLAYTNSNVFRWFIDTMFGKVSTFETGNISHIPCIYNPNEKITSKARQNLSCSRADWDSFEISWDFQMHPLITARGNYEEAQPLLYTDDIADGVVVTEWSKIRAPIAQAFDAWERETDRRFDTLKANEEELNRIFIDIYGLQDELTPEVADKDVTVRKADLGREIRSFISYAVGCMFGRYALDIPGLAFAGGPWDDSKYTSYIPEDDNILPITDADYFDDDIVTRFVDFVKVVYGDDTLAQNLEFIAKALYPNATTTARETIRRYFQSDFFKDHCKIYQKRPIYWLFDSGKQNGFKALVYLHRYDKYTVARVRTEYLHPLQRKYEAEVDRMNKLADLPETSARDKAEFKKQTEKIAKQITECRAYDQIISHMAAQTIELDLDDGVKVNYEKFQGVDVPRDDGKGSVKMDLLGKI